MWKLLRNGHFTKLFLGRIVSNIGDSMYAIAAMWLVYELTQSAFYTGLAGFLTRIPQVFQFLAGPLIDRWPLRKTLVATQLCQLLLVLIIPLTYYTGHLSVMVVLIIMPLISCIQQFSYPAQTVALPRVLKKEELLKGNSLFSFANQGIDMTFNGIAGILISFVGAVTIYLYDSIVFAIALFLFWSLPAFKTETYAKVKKKKLGKTIREYGKELKEGFHYVFHSIIRKFFIATIGANFILGIAFAVMPVYADFRGGAATYGFLMVAFSCGFLIGSLLSSVAGRFPLGMMMIVTYVCSAAAWSGSAFLPWNIPSIILYGIALIPLGASQVLLAATGQRIIPNQLLARVFSVISSISAAAMPVGSLVGGALGSVLGGQIVFAIGGLGMLFIAIIWLIVPELRTIPRIDAIDPDDYGLVVRSTENTIPLS
ncbi:MFS transporter [Bacillus chungangensis]|uniref:MFS family permease n=1 Tax=Bacillus chungangensis TaxID=587633 RepID=A0ABT9WVC1_9BACI|nr:MFS transporter [Bacillus chungangensis]MDQ0177248.1 MFS family permease [Bacillus chungangensis]